MATAVALAAPVCLAPSAYADGSAALAQQLYDDAKEAMAKGELTTACQKFAESNRLDPATGGTLLNLAVCHEKMGQIATAWAEFEEAAQFARRFARPDREKLAREHIDALRPRVSLLTLNVTEDPAEPVHVAIDGVAVERPAWGSIPLDPGDHTVEVKAAHKLAWTKHVVIGVDRERPMLEVPALADEPAPVVVAPRAAPDRPLGPTPEQIEAAHARRKAGFVLAGIGIGGVAIGAAFGITAIHLNSLSKQDCSAPGACPTTDFNGHHALLDADVSDAAFGVAIVGLAVGAGLLFSSPSSAAATPSASITLAPSVTARGGGLGLRGAW